MSNEAEISAIHVEMAAIKSEIVAVTHGLRQSRFTNNKLADSVMALSAAIGEDRDAKNALRRELFETRQLWEDLQRQADHTLKTVTDQYQAAIAAIGERLAKIETVVGIVERESTGAHRRIVDDEAEREPWQSRILSNFMKGPTRAQAILLAIVVSLVIGTLSALVIYLQTKSDQREHSGRAMEERRDRERRPSPAPGW